MILLAGALAAAAALGAAPGCPAALEAVRALPDAALPRGAAPVLARLSAEGAGGPTAALDAAADALRDDPSPAASLRFRAALDAHCALAARPALAVASPAERALLARILADPVYRRTSLDPAALRRRLLALWDRIVEALGSAEAERYADLGRTLFLVAAAGAAAAWLWAARRRRAVSGAGAASADVSVGHAPEADLDRAEAAAARGDGAEAIRLALRAALGALERDGAAPPAQALTNAELVDRARLAAVPGGAEALGALVAAFDRAVYGRRPVAAGEADAALAAARRLGAGTAEASP